MKHSSTLSPSEAPGIMQCPNYRAGGANIIDSNQGNKIHEYIENMFIGGRVLPVGLTKEQIQSCVTMKRKIINYLNSFKMGYKIECEQKVDIVDSKNNILTFGTTDLLVNFQDDSLIIGDIKSDFGYSQDDYTSQFAIYALGIMQKYNLKKIKFFCAYVMSHRLKVYDFDIEQCIAIFNCVWRRKFSTLPSHRCNYCKLCKKLLYCPEINKSMSEIGTIYSEIKDKESVFYPEKITNSDEMGKTLSFAKDTLKPYAKRIESIVKKIESQALNFSYQNMITGYERKVKTSKSVNDIETILERIDVTFDDLEQNNIIKFSLNKLIDFINSNNELTKKETKENIEFELMDIIKESRTQYLKRKNS